MCSSGKVTQISNSGFDLCYRTVSIVETVTAIVSYLDYTNLTKDQTPHGFLYDFKDGSTWKNSKYFQENPDALNNQLYSNLVEFDNPLGASKVIHKALNVYFSLVDIPKSLRPKPDNIFLVLTVLDKDLQEKKNYNHFIKPLVVDLKRLESGVQIGGRTVKVGLICYSADNFEASMVGGFSQCYSSFDVCRICHEQHKDLLENSGIPKASPWTIAEYDAAVDNLFPGECCEFGLNSGCIFNDLQSFHCTGQIPTDVMHDFCEKVAFYDVMSILKVLV
jgi:hypothetical protein